MIDLDLFPEDSKQPLSQMLPLVRDWMEEVAEGITYKNPPLTFMNEDVQFLYVKAGMVVIKTKRTTVRLPVSTTMVRFKENQDAK
jgi:hypothetical protein